MISEHERKSRGGPLTKTRRFGWTNAQILCGKGSVLVLTFRILGNEVWPLGHRCLLEGIFTGFVKSFEGKKKRGESGNFCPKCPDA